MNMKKLPFIKDEEREEILGYLQSKKESVRRDHKQLVTIRVTASCYSEK